MVEPTIEWKTSSASAEEITRHLISCDANFVPPLSSRVVMPAYVRKIVDFATRFEAWAGNTLVGMVAVYCNDPARRVAHVTSVSVLAEYNGLGIARNLMRRCILHATTHGMGEISLQVDRENLAAIGLYEKLGFVALVSPVSSENNNIDMGLELRGGNKG